MIGGRRVNSHLAISVHRVLAAEQRNLTLNPYARVRLFPFEVAFSALAAISGFLTLTRIGTSAEELNTLLPALVVNFVNFGYMFSGIAIIAGLALPRRDVEGFGLIQLASAVVIRIVALAFFAGMSPSIVALGLLYTTIVWACWVRLRALFAASAVVTKNGT